MSLNIHSFIHSFIHSSFIHSSFILHSSIHIGRKENKIIFKDTLVNVLMLKLYFCNDHLKKRSFYSNNILPTVMCVMMLHILSYFSFQPMFLNKGRGMCYPVCGVVHITDPLLLNEKRSSSSGICQFPLSSSHVHISINPMTYNHK